DVAGHEDSPSVPVEGAPRIDVEIACPLESVAAIADGEAKLIVAAIESDVDAFAAVFRKREPARHFRRPATFLEQHALLVVGDAEAPVRGGVDDGLREGGHG